MRVSFVSGAGRSFRPATVADFVYQLSALLGYDDHAATSESVVVKDAAINRLTSDYSDPYYDIQILGKSDGVALSVLDATGTLDANNRLVRVSDGDCRVLASSFQKKAIVTCDMTRVDDNTHDELASYVAGSLARNIVDGMTALVGDKTASSKPIFSVQNHAVGTYLRNPACWAAPVNLTGISPWNSRGSNQRAGTAITPGHTIQAAHYPLAVNDTMRFVSADNVVITRTVAAVQSIANTDVQIARLDSDLPAAISPLKFAPGNLYDYLPSLEAFAVPVMATDFEEAAFIKETCAASWSNASSFGTFRSALTEPFSRLAEAIIVGDSGNPVCMIISGSPVIVSHWYGVDFGPLYHLMLTDIGATISTLGGGHSLSTADLSSFTNYGA